MEGVKPHRTVPRATDPVLDYLATHDASCPLCRYNLRGLARPQCPECGQRLELTLGVVNARPGEKPFLKAWILLIVSLCMAVGTLGPVMTFMGPWLVMPQRWQQLWRFTPFVALGLLYLIASVPLAGAALLVRRRFCRLPHGVQWWLAGAALAIYLLILLHLLRRMM